jgi:hypothetical protein
VRPISGCFKLTIGLKKVGGGGSESGERGPGLVGAGVGGGEQRGETMGSGGVSSMQPGGPSQAQGIRML